jgi:tetratricopeptide (TPR) repeat protein
MKLLLKITFFFGLMLAFSVQTNAQIKTPAASPSAKVEQVVGLTTVSLEYSRPSVKDREIFGGLVPYGKAWRTGANSATKISFSEDVKLNGAAVKAGSYAVITKPMESEWTFMLYPYASGSWGSYLSSDVEPVTFSAKTSETPFKMESFLIDIGNLSSAGADIWFMWDRTGAMVRLEVPTDESVEKSIAATMAGPSAGDYSAAASYYFNEGKDLNKALKWITKSIEMDDREKFWILRTKSLIQAKLGDSKGAVMTAKRSLELAKEAKNDDYVRMNEASIKEWSGM